MNKVNRLQRIPVRTPSSDKTICFFWVPVSSIIRSFLVTGSGQGSSVSKVMVFAGSSRNRFEDFQEACLKDNDEVKAAKAKDFLSRLRGHINVLGPTAAGKSDTLAVIRRAPILRDNIQKKRGTFWSTTAPTSTRKSWTSYSKPNTATGHDR